MNKITLNNNFLIDELDLPSSALLDTIIQNSRWSSRHKIIFKHEDKFYQTHYSEGLTEQQDESPWEYEEEVVCIEVHLVEKVVEVWEIKE